MNRRFVYGKFHWPEKSKHLKPPPRKLPIFLPGERKLSGWDQIAVEVIREYGANELLGKLYYKGIGFQWTPLQLQDIVDVEWYKWYQKWPSFAEKGKDFYFDMEGSGHW